MTSVQCGGDVLVGWESCVQETIEGGATRREGHCTPTAGLIQSSSSEQHQQRLTQQGTCLATSNSSSTAVAATAAATTKQRQETAARHAPTPHLDPVRDLQTARGSHASWSATTHVLRAGRGRYRTPLSVVPPPLLSRGNRPRYHHNRDNHKLEHHQGEQEGLEVGHAPGTVCLHQETGRGELRASSLLAVLAVATAIG